PPAPRLGVAGNPLAGGRSRPRSDAALRPPRTGPPGVVGSGWFPAGRAELERAWGPGRRWAGGEKGDRRRRPEGPQARAVAWATVAASPPGGIRAVFASARADRQRIRSESGFLRVRD